MYVRTRNPVQFFKSHSVVLESICHRTTANRLIHDNTTEWLTFFGRDMPETTISCVVYEIGSSP